MKYVKLEEFEGTSTREVLKSVLRNGDPQRGMDIAEVGRRIKVIDKVEAARLDVLALEDAEWEVLRDAFEAASWVAADHSILRIWEAITKAPDHREVEDEAVD